MDQQIISQIVQVKQSLDQKLLIPTQCEEFIARCLRLKDGNVEKATKLIQTFHKTVIELSKWDATLQPSVYNMHYYSLGNLFPLKFRDSSGRRVLVGQISKWNPQTINFDEGTFAVWMLIQHAIANCLEDQCEGYIIIWDYAGFSLEQAWATKQRRLISVAGWLQNGVVGRMKEFHAVNHPRIVDLIYAGVRPFLSEKMRKRMNFHKSIKSLHDSVDPKMLPKFLGGQQEVEECIDQKFMDNLVSSDGYFQDMVRIGLPTK